MGTGAIHLEVDGHGAIAVPWAELAALVAGGDGTPLAQLIGHPVEVLGVRCMDADGREVSTALTGWTLHIGFRSPANV